jgi:zinc transport system permease protein
MEFFDPTFRGLWFGNETSPVLPHRFILISCSHMSFLALFQHDFEIQALVASVAVGLVCSLLSVAVVLKRMAFIGQGVSHAGFGGVGTAALLGYGTAGHEWQQDLIVLGFCLATAWGIGLMTRRRRLEADTAIGILLGVTMAWGVLAQNLRVAGQDWPAYRQWIGSGGYSPPWEAILFGSPLSVGPWGMWAAVAMAGAVIAAAGLTYRHLVFFAFDESAARVFGVRTGWMRFVLLTLVAIVTVVSIRLVGLVLVNALLVVPGAAAMMLSRRLGGVLIAAGVIGVAGAAGGLCFSLRIGMLSPGACIVTALGFLFVASWIAGRLRAA